ncbi:MAG: TolC family protein [Bacteroidota bacterium]
MHRRSLPLLTLRLAALSLTALLAAAPLAAQPGSASDAQQRLDAYVEEALGANLALQQRAFDLAASRHALAAARRQFFPALSVEARFSRAGGGRTVNLPLGDLLNPVYGTLNDLLAAEGQDPAFPTLANEEIEFLRDQEQDTRLRVVQPLYQPRLSAAVRLNRHLVASREAEVEAFRRALARDVRVAYFEYLQAGRAVAIFEAASGLVGENLRTAERLRRSDRVLADAVLRARAETFAVAQQVAEAERDRDLARSYLNALLNRPLDTPLEADEDATWDLPSAEPGTWLQRTGSSQTAPVFGDPAFGDVLAAMQDAAVAQRFELAQLDAAIDAREAEVRLNRAAYLPGVSAALDGGIQGRGYGFEGEQPFYLASVVLSWSLFDGGADRARVREAQAVADRTRAQRAEAAQQIRLQVQQAFDAVRVAQTSLATATERLTAAAEGFRLTQRLAAEGRANQVVFVDARTTLTSAQLNLNVTRYALLARLADLEFAVGGVLPD